MKQINLIKSEAIFLNGLRFNLTEDATKWLEKHNVSDYLLINRHLYDRLGPFIVFGDDVPEECINWFTLRWL